MLPLEKHCANAYFTGLLTLVAENQMINIRSEQAVMTQNHLSISLFCTMNRPPLLSSGESSWLQNGDVLCFLWAMNWIYMCYVEESRPRLWSNGQSSWLQIQRSWVLFLALPDFLRSSGSNVRSVGVVGSQTKATEFVLFVWKYLWNKCSESYSVLFVTQNQIHFQAMKMGLLDNQLPLRAWWRADGMKHVGAFLFKCSQSYPVVIFISTVVSTVRWKECSTTVFQALWYVMVAL
jgi:hypothetical protein